MRKKLTITIDKEVYRALYEVIGKRRISQFLEDLARPLVLHAELESAYQAMAQDTKREKEADEWCEGIIGDFADEDEAR